MFNHIAETIKPGSTSAQHTPTGTERRDKEHHHPTLNKKTSFFGRRRKKSVSEEPPMPSSAPPVAPFPPVPITPQATTAPTETLPTRTTGNEPARADSSHDEAMSPTSSLQTAMKPYLRTPNTPHQTFFDTSTSPTSPTGDHQPDVWAPTVAVEGRDDLEARCACSTAVPSEVSPPERRTNEKAMPLRPAPGIREASEGTADAAVKRDDDATESDRDDTIARDFAMPSAAAGSKDDRQASQQPHPSSRPDADGTRTEAAQVPAPAAALTASGDGTSGSPPVMDAGANATPSRGGKLAKTAPPALTTSLPSAQASTADAAGGQRRGSSRNSPLLSPSSVVSDYKSAHSIPIDPGESEDEDAPASSAEVKGNPVVGAAPAVVDVDELEPTAEDREKARKIFDGAEDFISKSTAAAWLGENGAASARARKAYLELFDWTNKTVLAAMRSLCERLILKGETQQVDRILDAVAARWCACNPSHGFKGKGMSPLLGP
jgi:hypothetical protein